jgi:hypothetical protein
MLQSPLANPDKKAGEESRNIRILALDTTDPNAPRMDGVYIYQTQPAAQVGAKNQDNIKIGDIAAISRSVILVAERDSDEGGGFKAVYRADLARATDISGREDAGGKTIEQASDNDLRAAGISVATKTMAVDVAGLGFRPDKFEGLALVDPTTIAVVNDNDFGVGAIDTSGRVVRQGDPPRLVVVRLPEPLQ